MAIDFSNTEIAFKHKSNAELKKAHSLFKMMGSATLVNIGDYALSFAFKLYLPVNWIIKKTIFSQFCGGENINDCKKMIATLHNQGVGTILDYSLEGKESDEDLDKTTAEIIKTIERAKADNAIPFSVFKPTGVSQFHILEKANEGIDNLTPEELTAYQRIEARFDKICKRASDLQVPLFIDAEDSWIQDTIDRLCEAMMWKYNGDKVVIYTTVQMYRWDRLQYIKDIHHRAEKDGVKIGLKIVRGAYMEKERERATEKGYKDPIQPNKKATDQDYNASLEYCISHLDTFAICAGSHNEESANVLVDLIAENKLDKSDFRLYFAQLLGMSNHISFNLSANGYNVAKYVPYGPIKEVMPYLIRRAKENTSVAGQTSRELSLIKSELKRRKKTRFD